VRGMGKILPSPPGRFHGDAEAWVSSNWETAERRLTLILDRGQSPVRISWGRWASPRTRGRSSSLRQSRN